MIKMGILSANHSRSKSIELIQEFKELKITDLALDIDVHNENSILYSAESMTDTSDGIYLDIPAPGSKLLKMIIRSSNHIFSRTIPKLCIQEIKELINLEREADCITQIFNPYIFLNENMKIYGQISAPLLINVSTSTMPEADLEDQLTNTFLYLSLLDKSELKKLDIFSIEGKDKSFVLDIRITFSSASVARILFSSQFENNLSTVDLFSKDQPIRSFQVAPLGEDKHLLSEQNAIKQFIKATKKQSAVTISLTELLKAKQILEEIKEKLNSRGSLLLQ